MHNPCLFLDMRTSVLNVFLTMEKKETVMEICLFLVWNPNLGNILCQKTSIFCFSEMTGYRAVQFLLLLVLWRKLVI